MNAYTLIDQIKIALSDGAITQAEALLSKARLTTKADSLEAATLHTLQGKAFMKQSRWADAMSSFLKAEAIDPKGPARECRLMLLDIMEFYNKDMFNQ